MTPITRSSSDLEVLDQRVRQQLLAESVELRRIIGLELDQPSDAHVVHALETERGKRPLHGLALRVQDALLRPDQHLRLHRASVPASPELIGSACGAPSENPPVIRSYASTYFARVFWTTSSGSSGPGGLWSQPIESA